jgi:hypothetical protein
MTTLSRRDLYDLVWKDPIRTLAATYGRPGPSDTLKLELKAQLGADLPTSTWIDGDSGKLEDQLTEIVIALGVAGEAYYRQRRVDHYEHLLKRREDNKAEVLRRRVEAERLERERRAQAAKERRDRLFGQARDWRASCTERKARRKRSWVDRRRSRSRITHTKAVLSFGLPEDRT